MRYDNLLLLDYLFLIQFTSQAFGFMTRVALYAAQIGYYPHFTFEDSNLTIKLKADDSDKQQQMAKFIEEISLK